MVIAPAAIASNNGNFPLFSRGGVSGSSSSSSSSTPGLLNVLVNTVMDARRHLLAAAVARSTSIFAMYPVDTIKVRSRNGII